MSHRKLHRLGLIGCGLLVAASVQAGDVNRKMALDIREPNLGNALTVLAVQADLQILFSQDTVAGMQAVALSGEYSGLEALRRLLANSNLVFVVEGQDTVIVRTGAAAAMQTTTQMARPQDPSTASAQPPAADTSGHGLEEVIVTAQKRVERLQDVPLAVTAVGAAQLQNRQINDTSSLVQAVPSLTFQQGNTPNNTTFRVRGIGTSLFSQGVEPSVSVVVDGVVAARQAQSFADFADIERIEILRGPQGTLFGKNSTAGVINIVTARPSDVLEGYFEVTAAEMDEYRIKGTVAGPLSDALRARVTGYHNSIGGQFDNVVVRDDYGGQEGYGVRGKLEWDATDSLNFLLAADYRKSEADCCRGVLVATSNPSLQQLYAPVVATLENRQTVENMPTVYEVDQKTFSLQADLDLGWGTVTSISAYQLFHTYNNVDVDSINTPVPVYVGGGANAAKYDDQGGNVDLKNLTQELRLASNGNQPLTYVVGLYYSDLTVERDFRRRRALCSTGLLGQPCAPAATVWQSAQHVAESNSENVSAFGQVEYNLFDGLTAIAGVRAQYEKIDIFGARSAPIEPGDEVFPNHNPSRGYRSADDTAVTGKIGLQYEFSSRAQTYVTYTRGYKGLGFDTEITADFANQIPVQPESVDAYELGFKGQLFDGMLNLAVAVFRADYTDLQVQANRSDVNTGIVQFVQTNAGSSRTQGVEFEATFRPLDSLSVNAGVTYLDTTLDVDGLSCALQDQGAAPILTANFPFNSCYRRRVTVNGVTTTSGPLQDVRDGSLPAAPRWRASLSPRLETLIPGTNLEAFAEVNVSYQDDQQFAVEQDPLLVQEAYTLVDASIGVRRPDSRYTVTFFMKNLFDENYTTNRAHGGLLASTANPFDLYANFNKDSRRYFGGTVGVRF